MKIILIASILVSLFTQAMAQVSDGARAHVKCFANLNQALFTPDIQKANPSLDQTGS